MNNTLLKLALLSALATTVNNTQATEQDMMIATIDPLTGEVIYSHCPAEPDCVDVLAANVEEDDG